MDDLQLRIEKVKKLSTREFEILTLVCKGGKTYDEIASDLVISKSTVQFHIGNIYEKLGIAELRKADRQREIGKFCAVLPYFQEQDQTPLPESKSDTEELSERELGKFSPNEPNHQEEDQVLLPEPNTEAEGFPEQAPVAMQEDKETVQTEAIPSSNQAVNNQVLWLAIAATILIVSLVWWGSGRLRPQADASSTQQGSTGIAPITNATLLPNTVEGSVTSIQPSSLPIALPSLTPTQVKEAYVCSETKRVQAPAVDRFVRNQGVSTFITENTQEAVLNDQVRAVAIDQRGLWIGYFATPNNPANGLGHYDKSSWANCNRPEGPAGKNVNAIAFDKMGHIWVALEKAGIAMFDGKVWVTYTTNDGLPSNDVFEITVDKDNNIWVGTWEGVAKFSGKVWSIPYTIQNNTLYDNHVNGIAFDTDGNIWVGYIHEGVSQYRKSDGKWIHHIAQTGGLGGNDIRDITIRPAKDNAPESVWFATADGGVSKFEQGVWTVYSSKNGLPSDDVEAVALDKYNRVWVATTKGVAYFDGVIWVMYDTLNTLSIAFGQPCQGCPFDDDHVWTGTVDKGLTHSRLPYTTEAIDVLDVTYPKIVSPGQKFSPVITIAPRAPYQLRQDRGDYLAVTSEDDIKLFGVYNHIGVTGIVEPGQPFKFVDRNTPVIAPQLSDNEQEKTFTLTYRLWMYTRYTGPYIPITFTVRRSAIAPTPTR